MKEIGGYFGFEQLIGKEYHKDLIRLNAGRKCLLYILKARNIRKLYIPEFLCSSLSEECDEIGCEYELYPVDSEFMPELKKKLGDREYVLIVNYFGQITEDRIIKLNEIYGNIIVDNTQAFFQRPVDGIDTFYTCRKFIGVADGGYLSSDPRLSEYLEESVSGGKMKYVIGRFEGNASDYYEDFKKLGEPGVDEPLMQMSKLTRNILGAVDYDGVSSARNNNFRYLAKHLSKDNKLNLMEPVGPFAYPFYSRRGLELKAELAKKKIYVPTLWPNVIENMSKDSLAYDYAANILPLPCDQRYTVEDMGYMIEELRKSMVQLGI